LGTPTNHELTHQLVTRALDMIDFELSFITVIVQDFFKTSYENFIVKYRLISMSQHHNRLIIRRNLI